MNRRLAMPLVLLASAAGAFASGCSMVTVRPDGARVRHHFGYVRVVTPPVAGNGTDLTVMEIDTFGVRVRDGAGVGYFHERLEYIPLDSRLIVRVANSEQLERALTVLAPVARDGLTVVTDRGAAR